MVIVWPAGAAIPAKPPINPTQLCQNLKTNDQSASLLRDAVLSYVSRLDVSSACSTFFHTLNIESVLPAHLQQRPTPREVGIVKFSLDVGILDQNFHAFIEPGTLPRGFMHEAQFHAETHRIPVMNSDFEEVTRDCRNVYRDILNFLDHTDVVFTLSNLVHYTQEALDWMSRISTGTLPGGRVQVLPLESLVSELMLLSTGQAGHTVRLRDELRPQILEHVTHIGCVYHATRDIPTCALSSSHRQAIATHGFLTQRSYFWGHLTALDISTPTAQPVGVNSVVDSLSKCNLSRNESSPIHRGSSLNQTRVTNPNMKQAAKRENVSNQAPRIRIRRRSCDSDCSSIFTLPDIFQIDQEDCDQSLIITAESRYDNDDNITHDENTSKPDSPQTNGFSSPTTNSNQYTKMPEHSFAGTPSTVRSLSPVHSAGHSPQSSSPSYYQSPLTHKNQPSFNQPYSSHQIFTPPQPGGMAGCDSVQNTNQIGTQSLTVSHKPVGRGFLKMSSSRPQTPVDKPVSRVGLGRGFLKTASRIPPRKPNS